MWYDRGYALNSRLFYCLISATYVVLWRRDRDSNPRYDSRILDFESSAFDHSAISPASRGLYRGWQGPGQWSRWPLAARAGACAGAQKNRGTRPPFNSFATRRRLFLGRGRSAAFAGAAWRSGRYRGRRHLRRRSGFALGLHVREILRGDAILRRACCCFARSAAASALAFASRLLRIGQRRRRRQLRHREAERRHHQQRAASSARIVFIVALPPPCPVPRAIRNHATRCAACPAARPRPEPFPALTSLYQYS